ncbi:hypothetical protein J6E39_05330 [bacterium]|nr:hypothetical protein [bacterium]
MSVNFPNQNISFNGPAPVGNKITNMPFNLKAWQLLEPYNYQLSLPGVGETQYEVMDMSVSPFIAQLAKMPAWYQTNPLMIGLNLSNNMPGYINPQQTQAIAQNAQTQGYNSFMTDFNLSEVDNLYVTVSGIVDHLQGILKSDQLTDGQKTRLNAELEKFKATQAKIKDLKDKSHVLNLETIKKQKEELIKEIQTQSVEMQKTVQEVQEELAKEGKKLEGTEGAGSAEGIGAAEGVEETSDAEGESPATRKVSEKTKKAEKYVMNKICQLIYEAIDGPGTNYDDDDKGMKNVIEQNINKDNVLEFFDTWNAGPYKAKKGDLITALMDDCEFGQKKEIADMLIEALAERALEDGIDAEKEVAAARMATKQNWFGVSSTSAIVSAVKKLKNKVAQGENDIRANEAKKEQSAKIKADNKKAAEANKAKKAKADAAKKQQEAIDKQTKTFIEDMKECTGNKKIEKLPAGVQVVKDASGNFKGFSIRIKGKEYFGKDYLALSAALEKDGLVLSAK